MGHSELKKNARLNSRCIEIFAVGFFLVAGSTLLGQSLLL